MNRLFLPAGSQDQVGDRLNNKAKLNETFRRVVRGRDFQAIETPVVEYAQTFTNPHVGMNLSKLLKWFDRDGEIEVLRSDWTTAIARALMNQNAAQLKWFYQGSVFRNDTSGIESRQAGIEIIRTDPLLGEMESLLTAVAYLKEIDVRNYIIELGHTGLFDYLIKSLELNQETEEQLRLALYDKKQDAIYQIINKREHNEIAQDLVELTKAFGGKEVLVRYGLRWQDRPELVAILNQLQQLVAVLEQIGVPEVIVDLGRVKELPYYSGTMFRGYLKPSGKTCFSGGRYDKLYAQFNEDITAIGLAFDIDVLTEVLKPEPVKPRICLVACPQTHLKAELMRKDFPNGQVDIRYQIPATGLYDQVIQIADEVKE
ncbi:ATP phosphoribosyltransferase regulatory subunit [Amphibacillus marinus]|uniref:ATP phosphoribosyltransferase regulatory subunit n=1 Tax=Amphibacillus marinus TaxID=872970 RepID=A0A1H8GVV4_9BACI|nr:ATP phosphoribosyltransferase regulatory subunit [Amphibacillus marinus]SEN47995.1 ATP phosphoribosyltransferase regulatory subunit [Amphibacillus marinus]